MADPVSEYFKRRIARAESSGKHLDKKGNLTKNQLSSAKGKYQVVDSTWNNIERQLGMQLDKRNEKHNEIVMDTLLNNYKKALISKNIPINETTLYMMHFKGNSDWVKKALENPNLQKSAVFTSKELKANPWLPDTLGGITNLFSKKMGKQPYKNSKEDAFIGNDEVRDKAWGMYNLELSNAKKDYVGEAYVQQERAINKKYYDKGWFPQFNAIIARQNANNLFAGKEKGQATFRLANNLNKYIGESAYDVKVGKQYFYKNSTFDVSKLSAQEISDIETVLGKKIPANNKINKIHFLTNLESKMALFLPEGKSVDLINAKTGERGKDLVFDQVNRIGGTQHNAKNVYIADFSKGNQSMFSFFGVKNYDKKQFSYDPKNDRSFVQQQVLNYTDFGDSEVPEEQLGGYDPNQIPNADGTYGATNSTVPITYSDGVQTTVNGYPYNQPTDPAVAAEMKRANDLAEIQYQDTKKSQAEQRKKEEEKAAKDSDQADLNAARSMFDNIENSEAPFQNVYDPKNYKQKIDWAGYAQSIFGIVAGKDMADKETPMRDEMVSEGYLNYASELQRLSEIGLRPEEEAYAKRMLTESYSTGLEQLNQASNGNRNIVLGNLSRLDYQKQEGLMKIALADANAKNEALYKYGEAMKYISEFDANKDIANNERKYQDAMMTKQTGSQLMSAGWKSLMDNIQYQKENKPGSANHMYKSFMMQKMFNVNPDLKDDGTGNTPYTLSWAKKQQEEAMMMFTENKEYSKKYSELSAPNQLAFAKYANKKGFSGSKSFLDFLHTNNPQGSFDFSKLDEADKNKNFNLMYSPEKAEKAENPTAPENNVPGTGVRLSALRNENKKNSIFGDPKSFAENYFQQDNSFTKENDPFNFDLNKFKLNPFDNNMFDNDKIKL